MDAVTAAQVQRPRVAVVMLTRNQCATTLAALASIDRGERGDVSIVLWDNGSTDGTVDEVRRHFPQVAVHHSAENLGVAGGRNAGAALAVERFAPDFLCFLDNDLVLTPGFLDALLEVLQRDPSIGQVQAKLRYQDRPEVLNYGGGVDIRFWIGSTQPTGDGEVDTGQYDREVDCVSCGGAMMVRTALFERLGGFDPLFNPVGPEDIDFSLRLRALGHRALFVPKALAYHKESHSFEPSGYTERYATLKARHWLRFLARHGTPWQKVAFFSVGLPLTAVRMAVREGRRGNLRALAGAARGALSGLWRRG
jgi:O-antigen biosynthesis protein